MKKKRILIMLVACFVCLISATLLLDKNKTDNDDVKEILTDVDVDTNIDTKTDTKTDTKNDTDEKEEPTLGEYGNPLKTSYIPESLLDYLADAILDSSEEEILKDMVSDKTLSSQELESYMLDTTFATYKKQLDEYNGYVLLVDADNDNIDDLFFMINDGGSMGNNSRILLKGNSDGSFIETSNTMDVTQELAFIKYKEKNYLIESSFNYNYKQYNGINIVQFENGKICEKVYLTLKADGYDISTHTIEDKYKPIAQEALDISKDKYDIADLDAEIITGEAETSLNQEDYESYQNELYMQDYNWLSCDLNNDGIDEIYTKGIFFTSTIHTVTNLQSAILTDKIPESDIYPDILRYCNIKEEGTLVMFWVSTVDNKNVINMMTYRDITNYAVKGYIVSKNDVLQVYEVNFMGNRNVQPTIYTRGINYEDDESGFEG